MTELLRYSCATARGTPVVNLEFDTKVQVQGKLIFYYINMFVDRNILLACFFVQVKGLKAVSIPHPSFFCFFLHNIVKNRPVARSPLRLLGIWRQLTERMIETKMP